jgi:hypothetical protein
MVSCCKHTTKHKTCVRKTDGKTFNLPMKFTKERCMQGVKGCAFNVYVNRNPSNTITDVKTTIRKLERLYKQGKSG